MIDEKTSLYDMTDILDCGGDPVPEETTEPLQESTSPEEETAAEKEEKTSRWIWAGVLGLCACALAAILLNWKKLQSFLNKG